MRDIIVCARFQVCGRGVQRDNQGDGDGEGCVRREPHALQR